MNLTAETSSAPGRRGCEETALAAVLLGLAALLAGAAMSDGWYHDDDIAHYLIARDSFDSARAMLQQWARPGYNLPAAAAARVGGTWGVRVLSALMTAATAWLAWRIVAALGLVDRFSAAAAPALVFLQPLAFTLGMTTLTETPAGLYLALGVWLMLAGRPLASCAAVSLLFVTRYEAAALAPLWALWLARESAPSWRAAPRALARGRFWAAAALLMWAPAAYAGATAMADIPPELSVLHMFGRGYSDEYGAGAWWHFLLCWLVAAGAGAAVLAVTGIVSAPRRLGWIAAVLAGYLGVQTLIFMRGMFASGGYPRFLTPTAAITAAAACFGIAALRRRRRRGVLAALLTLTAVQFVAQVRPLMLPVRPAASETLGWVREPMMYRNNLERLPVMQFIRDTPSLAEPGAPILALHPLIRLHQPAETRGTYGLRNALNQWRRARPGTLFVWDNRTGQWSSYALTEPTPLGRELRASLQRQGELVGSWANERAQIELYRKRAPAAAP